MIRVLEDAGGGRIRDAATKDLVSSREVVDDYNAMRDCLARVTRDMMPFMKMLCKNTQTSRNPSRYKHPLEEN